MAEFTFSNFLIAAFLFSMITGGLVYVYGDLGTHYNVPIDVNFNASYNKVLQTENVTLNLANQLKDDAGTFDTFVLAGKTILSVPRTIIDSMKTSIQVIASITLDLGLLPLFQKTIIGIITVLLVMGAVSLYARWKA